MESVPFTPCTLVGSDVHELDPVALGSFSLCASALSQAVLDRWLFKASDRGIRSSHRPDGNLLPAAAHVSITAGQGSGGPKGSSSSGQAAPDGEDNPTIPFGAF